MREWLYNLPEWQLQLLVVMLIVTGLSILQLAFAMGGLHDEDIPALVAQGVPAPAFVEPPPAGEPEGKEQAE